jgi:hypothetical protein
MRDKEDDRDAERKEKRGDGERSEIASGVFFISG